MEPQPKLATSYYKKFEQTKIGDLWALPEICKSRSTEIISKNMNYQTSQLVESEIRGFGEMRSKEL